MGVEAARVALRQAPEGAAPADVVFATTAPAYADKTNATAIHAALALPSHVGAYDLVGAVRSNVAACTLADRTGGLAVLADIRAGLPGGADEAGGGDAAVALALRRRPGGADRDDRRGQRHGRVPRPVAAARRAVVAAVGGALRRARLRPARRGGRDGRAQGGGDRCRRRRPRDRHRPAPAGGQRGPAHVPASAPRRSSTTSSRPSATPARPTPGCCWPTCSTAPSPGRRSPWCSSPTASTCGSCGRPTRWPGTGAASTVRERMEAGPRRPVVRPVPHLARVPPA